MAKSSEWLNMGLQIQQSLRAEQNSRAIEALRLEQAARLAEQEQQMDRLLALQREAKNNSEKQRNLKDLAFDLRQKAETAMAIDNPIARCAALLDVQDHAKQLDPSQFDEIQDKQWHAETLRVVENCYSQTAGNLGADVPYAIARLRTALLDVHRLAKTVMEIDAGLRESRMTDSQICKWNAVVQRLGDAVEVAETAAKSIPGAPLDCFPLGAAVSAAQIGILAPVRNDQFALKCLVLIAKADGKIEASELELLREVGRRYRISSEVVQELLRDTKSVSRAEFEGDVQTAERLLRNLYRCAAVDGRVSSSEEKMIQRIGAALGIPGETVADIVGGGGVGQEITILDPASTRAAFLSAPEKARKHAYLGDAIPAELFAWFRKTCGISDNAGVVISGEWKFLGIRTASALLTSKTAHLHTGPDKVISIPVEDIVDFTPGSFSGRLGLKDGTGTKTPNVMNDFLQALVEAITVGRRSV